jgi:DNA-binding CsgD family transcriptional regulator/tetratricopeptide (TPR) repeat protein
MVSCETKKSELAPISAEQVFVAKNIDQEYLQTTPNEQWFLLLKILKSNYKNTSDVETWLLNKFEKKTSDTNGLTDTLLKELNVGAFQKDYMKVAEKLARFTLNTAEGRKYQNAQVDAVVNLSQHFNDVKQKDSLKKYVDLLNDYIKTDTTSTLRLVYHSSKANLESLNGDFFLAVVHYHKAIDLTESSEKLKLGTLYHNLATMYLNMDYLDKAKTNIDSSLVILGFDKYPTYLYNSLGIIQTKTKSYKEAEKTYQTIIRIAKEEKMSGLLAQSYANYGNLKRREGNYYEALHFIQLSDSICNEMGIDFGKIINNINRAEVYYDQKEYAQAAQTLNLIENEIKSFDLAEINKGFYELSYRVHDALGNVSVANAYFRIYRKNKETYTGDLPRSIISEWELSRERERGSQLTDQHNLLVYQQKQTNYFYAFIITLLVLGVVSIYFVMNKKRLQLQELLKLKHQKTAFDLELKSKALLTESLKNISIQQSKSLIKADLDSVLKELPIEYRTKFNGLKGKLEAPGLDAFLVDFENRFIGVYEVFYDKLKAISSDLTPNEMIICAMLRLNYTSKEISYLTNRTVRTIENNRSIIRKKLNLEADVNLQQFIFNL